MNQDQSQIPNIEKKRIQLHQLIQQRLESLNQISENDFKDIKQTVEQSYEEIVDEFVSLIRSKKKECLNQIPGVVKSQEISYKLCLQRLQDIEKSQQKKQFEYATKIQSLLKKAHAQSLMYQNAMQSILRKQDVISSVIRQIQKKFVLSNDVLNVKQDSNINNSANNQKSIQASPPLTQQDILLRVEQQSKHLKVFNLQSHKMKVIKTSHQFPKNFAVFQVSFSLFVSGGELDQIQSFQFINIHSDGTTINLQNMKNAKQLHSLTGNQMTLIQSCGIYSGSQSNSINQFNLSLNKWKKLQNCLQAKSQHASCLFNGKFLYLFGGKVGDTETSFIEKLSCNNDKGKWQIVECGNQLFIPAKCLSSIQCQNSVILLFGSFKTQQNLVFDVSQDDFVMDIEDDDNHPDASNGIVSIQYKGNLVVLDNSFSVSVWNGEKWRLIYQEKQLQ